MVYSFPRASMAPIPACVAPEMTAVSGGENAATRARKTREHATSILARAGRDGPGGADCGGTWVSSAQAQTPQTWAAPQGYATEQAAVPCVCPFPQGYCPFPQGYCPPPVGPCAPVVATGQMPPVAPAPPAVVPYPPPLRAASAVWASAALCDAAALSPAGSHRADGRGANRPGLLRRRGLRAALISASLKSLRWVHSCRCVETAMHLQE